MKIGSCFYVWSYSNKEKGIREWIQLKSHILHLDLFRTPTDNSNAKTSDKDYNVVAGEKEGSRKVAAAQ